MNRSLKTARCIRICHIRKWHLMYLVGNKNTGEFILSVVENRFHFGIEFHCGGSFLFGTIFIILLLWRAIFPVTDEAGGSCRAMASSKLEEVYLLKSSFRWNSKMRSGFHTVIRFVQSCILNVISALPHTLGFFIVLIQDEHLCASLSFFVSASCKIKKLISFVKC